MLTYEQNIPMYKQMSFSLSLYIYVAVGTHAANENLCNNISIKCTLRILCKKLDVYRKSGVAIHVERVLCLVGTRMHPA